MMEIEDWTGRGTKDQWLHLSDGDEDRTLKLQVRAVVCYRCHGHGKHDHPAFSNGITGDEMRELGDEFREDYPSGVYDVPCTVCKGERVVWCVDMDDLMARSPEICKLVEQYEEDEAHYEAIRQAEIRMGA